MMNLDEIIVIFLGVVSTKHYLAPFQPISFETHSPIVELQTTCLIRLSDFHALQI
jgi:hypothetical protein